MATQEPYNPFPKQPVVAVPAPPQRPSGNGMAIAGMVVGIIGLVAFFIPYVGPIISLFGLVFSIFGLRRAGVVGGSGKGMAIAGIACAASGIVVGGFVTYLFVTAFKDYASKSKRAEAEVHLQRIQKGIKTYWIEMQTLPPSSSKTLPGEPGAACTEPGQKFAELPYSVWAEDPGWSAIGFEAWGGRYSYRWTKESETSGIVEAFADLDCDGQITTTTGTITVRADVVTFELGRPTSD